MFDDETHFHWKTDQTDDSVGACTTSKPLIISKSLSRQAANKLRHCADNTRKLSVCPDDVHSGGGQRHHNRGPSFASRMEGSIAEPVQQYEAGE